MTTIVPELSISLPVYNGERFLREALNGMLAQTFGDFELIVTDNASKDATPDICHEYAARDARVRYYRNPTNEGANANFERGAALARGRFFKWMAHDDIHAPTFLERCIATLRAHEDVCLVHCRVRMTDETGQPLNKTDTDLSKAASHSPVERFATMIGRYHYCTSQFGVIRRSVLAKTRMMSSGYHGADRALLAELALLGRIVHLPDELFLNRTYPTRESLRAAPRERMRKFGVPHMTLLLEDYRAMIDRHIVDPLERRAAHAAISRWWWHRGNFLKPTYERLACRWPVVHSVVQQLRGRPTPTG